MVLERTNLSGPSAAALGRVAGHEKRCSRDWPKAQTRGCGAALAAAIRRLIEVDAGVWQEAARRPIFRIFFAYPPSVHLELAIEVEEFSGTPKFSISVPFVT